MTWLDSFFVCDVFLGLHLFIYLVPTPPPEATVKRLYNPKSYVADLWISMCVRDKGGRARRPVVCRRLPPAWVRLRRLRAASSCFFSLHPAVFRITAVFIFFVEFLWLYLTALNCCSPGCFHYQYHFSWGFGWERCHQTPRRPRRGFFWARKWNVQTRQTFYLKADGGN